jgi:hypothetical protein
MTVWTLTLIGGFSTLLSQNNIISFLRNQYEFREANNLNRFILVRMWDLDLDTKY